MARIIALHGTFASGPKHGPNWWQGGSDFEREVLHCVEAVDGKLVFEPFGWTGHNSERARRKAAAKLTSLLRSDALKGERCVLVGHSHGGSVIAHALLEAAARNDNLELISRWITIGTPFIGFRRRTWLAAEASGNQFLWIIVLSLLCAAFQLASLSATPIDEAVRRWLPASLAAQVAQLEERRTGERTFITTSREPGAVNITTSPLLLPLARTVRDQQQLLGGLSMLTGLALLSYILHTWRKHRQRTAILSVATMHLSRSAFEDRWLALNHRLDEAVGGLSRINRMRASAFWLLPPSERARATFHGLAAILLLVALSVWAGLMLAAVGTRPSLLDLVGAIVGHVTGRGMVSALLILALLLAAWIALIAAIASIHFLGRGAARLLAVGTDRIVQAEVGRLSLGVDVPAQLPASVADRPPWASAGLAPLPDVIGDEISSFFDDGNSAELLRRVREELHRALDTTSDARGLDVARIAAVLELLHTNYFRSSLFRKLVCCAIASSPGFRPSARLAGDPDYTKLMQWLAVVRHPSVASPG